MDGFDLTPHIIAPAGTKYIALGLIENKTSALGFDDYTCLGNQSGCKFFKLPVDDSYIVSLTMQGTRGELTVLKRVGSVSDVISFDVDQLEEINPGPIKPTSSAVILVALPNNWAETGQAAFSLMRGQVETLCHVLAETPEIIEKASADNAYIRYTTTNAHYKKLLDFKTNLESTYYAVVQGDPMPVHHHHLQNLSAVDLNFTRVDGMMIKNKLETTPHRSQEFYQVLPEANKAIAIKK